MESVAFPELFWIWIVITISTCIIVHRNFTSQYLFVGFGIGFVHAVLHPAMGVFTGVDHDRDVGLLEFREVFGIHLHQHRDSNFIVKSVFNTIIFILNHLVILCCRCRRCYFCLWVLRYLFLTTLLVFSSFAFNISQRLD